MSELPNWLSEQDSAYPLLLPSANAGVARNFSNKQYSEREYSSVEQLTTSSLSEHQHTEPYQQAEFYNNRQQVRVVVVKELLFNQLPTELKSY